jgi:hypothetical protein
VWDAPELAWDSASLARLVIQERDWNPAMRAFFTYRAVYNRSVRRRALQRVSTAAFIVTIGVVPFLACGSFESSGGPPPLGTGTSAPKPDDASSDTSSIDDVTLEPNGSQKTYKGTLATTKTVKFGGSPYCEYTITIKEIGIEILQLEDGRIALARVRNVAVETSVPPCPHPPMDPSNHDYALASATKTASGITVKFVGAASNRPNTSLVIDLVQKGDGFDAAAEWKRIDQKAPLDWLVTATIPLARQ